MSPIRVVIALVCLSSFGSPLAADLSDPQCTQAFLLSQELMDAAHTYRDAAGEVAGDHFLDPIEAIEAYLPEVMIDGTPSQAEMALLAGELAESALSMFLEGSSWNLVADQMYRLQGILFAIYLVC